MKIPCSSCNQRLEIPDELAGQTIECPACNASLAVPSLAPTPSVTPQVKVTTPQAATPQKPTPQRKTAAPPKAASSKKSKSLIPKLAVACIASVVILSLFFVLTAKVEAPDISIHDAAGRGNIEAVKQHLDAGTDVNAKDRRGFTPLHNTGRSKEVTELLIANGADLEAKTNKGNTPLIHAALRGRSAIEVIELLIVKGADVNYVNAKDKLGETQLDVAIQNNRHEIADLLRKHGGKHSTINTAAKAGDAEAVKEFLAAGADVNARGLGGLTPLDFAASKGDKETTDLLRKHGGKTYPELKAAGN